MVIKKQLAEMAIGNVIRVGGIEVE